MQRTDGWLPGVRGEVVGDGGQRYMLKESKLLEVMMHRMLVCFNKVGEVCILPTYYL